jgi:DNA repair exonuclease SbcCD ATPase subunit
MEDLEGEKSDKSELYQKLCNFSETFAIADLKEKKLEIDELQSQIEIFEKDVNLKQKEFDRNSSKKKLLEGIPCGVKFPKCKFIRDANVAVSHLPVIQNEIDQTQEQMIAFNRRLKGMSPEKVLEHLDKFQQILDRKVRVSSRITEIGLEAARDESALQLLALQVEDLEKEHQLYEDNKEAIENLEELTTQKDSLESSLKLNKKMFAKCEQDKLQFYKQTGSIEEKIKNLEAEQKQFELYRSQYSAYDLYMQCMHSNGIAFDVIKKKLPIINEEIAKTISNIVDFEIFFEVDGSKFEIYIRHPTYGSRPLEMGSGAEKTIAAMAIRMALLTVSSMPKGDIFILDEPGTSLDEENMEGFIRMLELIKVNFNTVLLISHLDSLKDCVDMQIVIDKKDGYAYVKQ